MGGGGSHGEGTNSDSGDAGVEKSLQWPVRRLMLGGNAMADNYGDDNGQLKGDGEVKEDEATNPIPTSAAAATNSNAITAPGTTSNIRGGGIASIAAALRYNTVLSHLSLWGNVLGDSEAMVLAEGLSPLPKPSKANAGDEANKWADYGNNDDSSTFHSNSSVENTLRMLELAYNRFTVNGVNLLENTRHLERNRLLALRL